MCCTLRQLQYACFRQSRLNSIYLISFRPTTASYSVFGIQYSVPAEHVEAVSRWMLEKQFVEAARRKMLFVLPALLRRPIIGEQIGNVSWTSDFGRRWNGNKNENDISSICDVSNYK